MAACCFLGLAITVLAAPDAEAMRHVLVLQSYHQGYPFTDGETRGINQVFNLLSNRVEQHVVYMDAKRMTSTNHLRALREVIAARCQTVRMDGVLAADNDALGFVVTNRTELFAGIPIVFCGINEFHNSMLGGQSNITGVVENTDYEETIALALRLFPQAKRVIAVTDSTTTGLAHESAMRRISKLHGEQWLIEILSMGDYGMDEFLNRLHEMNGESIVLLLNHYRDRTGRAYSHEESLALLRKACRCPLFVVNDIRVRPGVVGGRVVSGVRQGRTAAEMLLRAMAGEPFSNPPILRESPNVWMFDYQGLQQWQISQRSLPPGSLITGRPDTFWVRHRAMVFAAMAVAALLTAIIVALFVNIARRKRIEVALLESHRRLAALFEGARDAIIVMHGGTGQVEDMNAQAEALLGVPKSQMVGQAVNRLFPPEKAADYRELLLRDSMGKSPAPVQVMVSTSDGRKLPMEVNASLVDLGSGRKVIVGIFRDVSERDRLTEQLRQAQKMEAIGHLAGGVAHDFNNLLTVIQGHTALLEDDPEVARKGHESLAEVAVAARKAADLTRQLLAFGRRQIMRPERVNLNHIVDHQLQMMRRVIGEHINLQASYHPEALWIEADTAMIEQVITNLLVNAREAMPQGGQLNISTSLLEIDRSYPQRNPDAAAGWFSCLTVTDTGVGMDTSTTKRLFEPFFTTKDVGKGTGLGLASVYGIVKQHGGWIEVRSRTGAGTTFTVFLPDASNKAQEAETP